MKPLVLVFAFAAVVAAADQEPTLFDQAREKKLARQPKEAAALYQRAIAASRFDLPSSAPALVELVECFQLLKDDAVSAAQYREVSAKWLTKPPALDGTTALGLDAAEEDLLWKPWPGADGKPQPLITFTVDSAERQKSLQNGVAKSQLRIGLKAKPAPGMPLQAQMFSFGGDGGQALAIDADGGQHTTSQVMLSSFTGEVDVYLTFTDIAATVTKLKRLSGTVTMTQRKEWKLAQAPLRDGELVGEGEGAWKIAAVQREGELSVTLRRVLVLKGAEDLQQALSAAGSASASSGGGNGGGDIWLTDASGRRIDSHGMSSSSDGSSQTVTLGFGAIAPPPTLVYLQVMKTSSRDVPFAFDGVDLP